MRILCVADEEDKSYWDYFKPEKLAGIDLIISAGDLKASYLSFLVTMGHAPVLYVHGNHDHRYEITPPEGCDCIDDKVVEFRGYRIAGLGGCKHFRKGPQQYTEKDMRKRARKLRWKLRKGVDILVAHAPAAGYGDLDDLTHSGFQTFVDLIDDYKPLYFLHGHIHSSYNHRLQREYVRGDTKLINVGKTYILDLPDRR